MLVVARPRHEGTAEAGGEVMQLRCQRCGRSFRSLEEAFLTYEPPAVGAKAVTHWCHKKCVAGEAQVRLVRGDFALKRLIESLVRPSIPLAALHDRPSPRRSWGDP